MATKPTAPKIEVPARIMEQVSVKERQLIRRDALKGIDQSPNSASMGQYKSEQYKKYKNNYMKRFTDRTGAKGTHLKAYTGQSVKNNQTGFKNYYLTGRMLDDTLAIAKLNECNVFVQHKDRGKVLGAADNGDILMSLNNANANTIKIMLIKYMNKQVVKWARKDLNLVIG